MRTRFLVFIFIVFVQFSVQAQSTTTAPPYLPSDTIRNFQAPAFVMKDLQGKSVSLADYKGKVLVLDFWATWCAPCHETFPFVSMTMNKYKSDPNVQFLFVDTRERAADKIELVKKFISKNGYSFNVVLDENNEAGKQEKFYQQFHIRGLPTRIIIDTKGVVRFESIGYPTGKTDEELSAILTWMIEAAKKS